MKLFISLSFASLFIGLTFADVGENSLSNSNWRLLMDSSPLDSRYGSNSWSDDNGDGYIFGGYGVNQKYYNDLWKYNYAINKWILINPNPELAPRYGANSWVSSNDQIYLFGGRGTGNVFLNDFWKYNIRTNTWFELNSNTPLKPRFGASSWQDNQQNLYIFGGSSDGGTSLIYLNDLWMYNVKEHEWKEISEETAPSPRTDAIAWTDLNGNGYIFGGAGIGGGYLNDLWKFDVINNKWLEITDNAPIQGRADANAWLNSKGTIVYIFGGIGLGSTYFNDLWKYNIKKNEWTKSNVFASISPRFASSMFVLKSLDIVYIFGGVEGAGSTIKYYNDLWRLDF